MGEIIVDQEELEKLQKAYDSERTEKEKLQRETVQSSMFGSYSNENLISYQLELDNILERIDHLLRGHELKFSDKGELRWIEPKDKNAALFNNCGVQEILRILSMYLNRNTILSNYDEKTINWKVYDFSIDLTDLIHNKYEEMFFYEDYEELKRKFKLFPMIVRELVDTVHSAYLRALNGGERQSLREARHVSQNINPYGISQTSSSLMPKKSFSIFKPSTWKL